MVDEQRSDKRKRDGREVAAPRGRSSAGGDEWERNPTAEERL
jgi:hypothetical protein